MIMALSLVASGDAYWITFTHRRTAMSYLSRFNAEDPLSVLIILEDYEDEYGLFLKQEKHRVVCTSGPRRTLGLMVLMRRLRQR
jgi:hypothetical protein